MWWWGVERKQTIKICKLYIYIVIYVCIYVHTYIFKAIKIIEGKTCRERFGQRACSQELEETIATVHLHITLALPAHRYDSLTNSCFVFLSSQVSADAYAKPGHYELSALCRLHSFPPCVELTSTMNTFFHSLQTRILLASIEFIVRVSQ